ncbi:D-aminoacyl-tRNA deacylase [Temperatibacter marinus]|uniref:D-aminoacyl-tRNA deacylase n=1 Tax=Temperatibacter marinus TaxID=1456591 RepID=A0AA52EAX2_9PROT|nr:D-aminoacyl-tRNA deacylase [Temperatibacter marinus]WND01967.1 D-aminoacyl-tRNA deacylase [Temperatibacter marinus]
MRALLQRVSHANVIVDHKEIGRTERGLLILLCAMDGDTEDEAVYLASKIAKCRLFPDENGKTNLSILDIQGAALVVSQFTLSASWKKGNRPGFSAAADPETAKALYHSFCKKLEAAGVPVETGEFAASMQVNLSNEGPFTIWMDTQQPT